MRAEALISVVNFIKYIFTELLVWSPTSDMLEMLTKFSLTTLLSLHVVLLFQLYKVIWPSSISSKII